MNTLWSVKSRLWELVTLRREMIADVAFTPEQEAERQACIAETDSVIRAYIGKELKADPNTVHTWFMESKAEQADLKRERDRIDGLLARAEGDYERAKTLVMEVMGEIGEKRLPVRGTLRTQPNGGVRGVDVRQPEMVPAEYLRVSVKMSLAAWYVVRGRVSLPMEAGTPEPNLTAIHDALERCEPVAGCILRDRGESLRIA
jgi:hypothetical protein